VIPTRSSRSITAYWLGRIGYERAHALQERIVEARIQQRIGDTLLLLEHDAVITLGRGAKATNILTTEEERRAQGVELFETGRGGDVTFHGPGQLVAYPIFDLKPDRQDVRKYVRDLAEVMIRLAADHGIAAGVVPGDSKLVGVWVDENAPTVFDEERARRAASGEVSSTRLAKIGAIGVRLSRWVTMHGFAFNVATDLSGFRLIVPCGIQGLGVTSVAALGRQAPSVEEEARAVHAHFAAVFGAEVTEGDASTLDLTLEAPAASSSAPGT
jgi:lipoyl(octanoyl) transferase